MTKLTVPPEIRLELLNNLLSRDAYHNMSPELRAWCAKALGMKDWKKYQETRTLAGYFDSGFLPVTEGDKVLFRYRVVATDIREDVKLKLPRLIYEISK